MGVVLRQAWSKSQLTVLMGITISTNVKRYETHHRLHFFFFQKDSARVGWLVGWGLTALLTQNRSYRACRFVGIFYSQRWDVF